MKAISIRQPWPWAILNLGKDIENRTWETKYRGPLLIHASKTFDLNATFDYPKNIYCGGIVGMVNLVNVVKSHTSVWYEPGCFAWIINNPEKLPFIKMRGYPGIFNVDDKLINKY